MNLEAIQYYTQAGCCYCYTSSYNEILLAHSQDADDNAPQLAQVVSRFSPSRRDSGNS